jgi:RNA-directed DNA polymerase
MHADALWEEVEAVLAPLGLRLSAAKSRVCHLDEGLDFLGFHIQRRQKRGTSEYYVYTYPSKKALASIVGKVRGLTRRAKHRTLADLLRRLNPVLRGWCNYFHHGVSSRTFGYVDHFAFWRVVGWLRKRHVGLNMHTLGAYSQGSANLSTWIDSKEYLGKARRGIDLRESACHA